MVPRYPTIAVTAKVIVTHWRRYAAGAALGWHPTITFVRQRRGRFPSQIIQPEDFHETSNHYFRPADCVCSKQR